MAASTLSEKLSGKVAVVTGAMSGIGAATARALTEASATVVWSDVTEPEAGTEPAGFYRCDVGEQHEVEALFAHCEEAYGGVDIVFHAAGIGGGTAPLADYGVELWDEVMRVNLRGSFLVTRSAISSMLRRGGGSIVLTASIGAILAAPQVGAYGVSKAGVVMLVKQAAADYAAKGIRVNGVAPGVIETPMVGRITPELRRHLASQIPQARVGSPAEVAGAVVFLASDDASYVNGVVLPVDGARIAV